jgi:hypothetical protein
MNTYTPLITALTIFSLYAVVFLIVTVRTWMNRIEKKMDEIKRSRV